MRNTDRKKVKGLLLTFIGLTTSIVCTAQLPQLATSSPEEVLKAMTVEEKARFISGNSGHSTDADRGFLQEARDRVPGCAGTTYPIPRLGIPAVILTDGPAGVRIRPNRDNGQATYYCTHFPVATILGSSWNTTLVGEVAKAMGNETLENGSDVLLAPGINIQRHPLAGRNYEYFSEDPYLTGRMGIAYVDGVQSNGVGTSIKHFTVNSQKQNNVHLSVRALREIYMKPFEMIVKASLLSSCKTIFMFETLTSGLESYTPSHHFALGSLESKYTINHVMKNVEMAMNAIFPTTGRAKVSAIVCIWLSTRI